MTIRLTPIASGSQRASFGLPLPLGAVANPATMSVKIAGAPVAAQVTELLPQLDQNGARVGARSVLIQFDPALVAQGGTDVAVAWTGGGVTVAPAPAFNTDAQSFSSQAKVQTATRTIVNTNGVYSLKITGTAEKVSFTGREPRVLATFPDGYLGETGILGNVMSKAQVAGRTDLAGLGFLSSALEGVLRSAMYDEPYPLNPDLDSVGDFDAAYEAWLYDRCATFLIGYTHVNDTKFLRHSLRTCSYYAGKIELTDPATKGTFTGKPGADIKYSHIRGLYAYYALTGDERAMQAMTAMADMWLAEPYFVTPYRQGKMRGLDKLWTERLLGTSIEGLLYGHRLKGDVKYLTAFKEMLATAYTHITGDQAALDALNPGAGFKPQNCFIHTAAQHGEGEIADPWCSPWMSELALDVLLQWHQTSNDPRALEIITRLTRFLRDVGANYFRGNPVGDSFLQPQICLVAGDDNPRKLVPLYGAAIGKDGLRDSSGEYEDYEHCTDASALSAAGRWALTKGIAQGPAPAPFTDEKQSFEALHNEFLACASNTFDYEHRTHRDPATWTSAQLAEGASDPATFIKAQKIGYPQRMIAPLRKIGWWFNMSALQFSLLSDAKIALSQLKVGWVQPAACQ